MISWLPHVLRGLTDCFNDLHIPRAPAEIAGDGHADVVFGRRRVVIKEIFRAQESPGRTEAAMDGVMIKERFLQRTEPIPVRKSLHRRDPPPVYLRRQNEARIHGNPIQQHGARSALSDLTSPLRPGEAECVAEDVEERLVGRDLERVCPAVD
jgi:hypothetical protein